MKLKYFWRCEFNSWATPTFMGLLLCIAGCELKTIRLSAKPEKISTIELGTDISFRIQDHEKSEINKEGVVWKNVPVTLPGTLEIETNLEPKYLASSLVVASFANQPRGAKSVGEIFVTKHNNRKTNIDSVRLSVEPGNYAVGFKSYEHAALANIKVNFFPADPEAVSGTNKNQTGATELTAVKFEIPKSQFSNFEERFTDKKFLAKAVVSYRAGNKSDWYTLPESSGRLKFSTLPDSRGVLAQIYFPDGSYRKLNESEVMQNTKGVHVLVAASEPLAEGEYQLSFETQKREELSLKGIVLRSVANQALIALGSTDGVVPGMTGEILNEKAEKLQIQVGKILKRSSEISSQTELSESLVGSEVRLFLQK